MAPKAHSAKFLAEVLDKIADPDKRAQAKALLDDPTMDGVVDFMGDGTLRQSDYSKAMNDLKAKEAENDTFRTSLDGWYAERQAALAEYDRIKASGGHPPVTPPVVPPVVPDLPKNLLTREDLDKTLDQVERGAVSFFSQLNALSLTHYQQFGEILDTDTLLKDKRLSSLGLEGVYKDVHKDQLTAKAQEATAAAEAKIRADERQKVQVELAGRVNPSYVGVSAEPSAFDGLEALAAGKPAPVHATVEDMSASYARLQGTRAAG